VGWCRVPKRHSRALGGEYPRRYALSNVSDDAKLIV
jgi:hypothetical protein